MSGPSDAAPLPGGASPPDGWYPDPAGEPSLRRWDGAAWGDATRPFVDGTPDGASLSAERAAWRLCRSVSTWGLAAPALLAVVLAWESPTYEPLRRWVRADWQAYLHHLPTPPLPTDAAGASSSIAATAHLLVLVAVVLGVVAWLRFCVASLRVAAAAGYPQRHRVVPTVVLFFVPVAGPLVSGAASRDCLPEGHEARETLGAGWGLVAAGELGLLALYATLLATSSQAAAWGVATLCVLAWTAAAVQLPAGLEAIADDHATLGVRRAPGYS